MSGPAVAGPVPSGRAIRRFTAATTNTRAGAGMGDLLGDVYYVAVIAAIGLAMALGVAGTLREALPSTDAAAAPVWDVPGLSLAALVAAILVGYAGVVLSLAGRLGPVSAGGPEAAWWLPLPVERRGLLRPAQWRVPAVAALASGVLVGILDAGLLGAPDGGRVARTVVGSALAAALVVLTAALGQTFDASRRATALAGEVVLLAAPVVALGGAVLGWRLAELPPVPPVALGALAVVAVGVGVVVDRRLDRIPARTLRAGGAVASQAVGAMVSLDTRELGRALSEGSARPRRRRSLRMGLVRGPASALVTADALVLTRSVRHLVQLAVTALVPALVATAPQLAGPVGFALALVVGGYVAMTSSAEGARRAEMAPVLDRLLPLAAREVRLLRMVVPGVTMALWSLVAFGVVGLWSGDPASWLALGLASSPVWAGAAVRSAYRPAPDWGAPLVSTPMGALPTGVTSVLARGPDVVALGLVPVLVCVFIGRVPSAVLVVQMVLSLVVVAIGSSTTTLAQRLGAGQDATRTGGDR